MWKENTEMIQESKLGSFLKVETETKKCAKEAIKLLQFSIILVANNPKLKFVLNLLV